MWSYGEVREQPVRASSYAARSGLTVLNQDGWDDTEEMADELWEKVVNSLDFSRILISAAAEHLRLQEAVGGDNHPDHILVQEICPACVRFALLTKER